VTLTAVPSVYHKERASLITSHRQLAMVRDRPCRARPADRSLVAEDRSAEGVRDRTEPDFDPALVRARRKEVPTRQADKSDRRSLSGEKSYSA
jgi:hypothetical protein